MAKNKLSSLILISALLSSLCLRADNRLRMFIIDSSYLYGNKGNIGIEFTKKKGRKRLTYNAGGNMSFDYFDFKCLNCSINLYGEFQFDREKLFKLGKDPVIMVSKRNGQFNDTLRIHIPRPVAVAQINVFNTLQAYKDYQLKLLFTYDDGRVASTLEYPSLMNEIELSQLPPGVQFTEGRFSMNAHILYDSFDVYYRVKSMPTVRNRLHFTTSYVYDLYINGKGQDGFSGSRGSSGSNGSSYKGSNVNGNSGGPGSHGSSGGDGVQMKLYLKTVRQGLILVRVESERHNGLIYYLDIEGGGKIDVNLDGGNGGAGGSGGSGGYGADGTESSSPGYGGNGGSGGNGGFGGRGGNLTIYTDSAALKFANTIAFSNLGGRGGNAGSGGSGGVGGSNYKGSLLSSLFTGRRGNSGPSGQEGMSGQNGYPPRIVLE